MATNDVPQARRADRVNDMPNSGDGWSQGDREELGVLRTRMTNVERAIQSVGESVANLSAKFDKKSEIPWQALGVMLAFVGMIGGALYWPIREGQSELKIAMVEMTKTVGSLGNQFVSIRELEGRSGRTQADIARLNTDLNAQELNMRRSVEQADTNLQRQLDDMKKAFGDTFSLRDALLQMQRRIDQLEAARRAS